MFLLHAFMQRFVTTGCLTIIDAHGQSHRYQGRETAPSADTPDRAGGRVLRPSMTLRFHDARVPLEIAFNPRLRFAEALVDGRITVEDGSIRELVDLLAANSLQAQTPIFSRAAPTVDRLLRRLHQFNPAARAKRNAAHHYNISHELYELFLDADRQYSCAYFDHPEASLDEAQTAKKRHIAAKLRLRPGARVLDIGCGWGGLGLYLAGRHDCQVQGITLASEQVKVARARAETSALSERARFELRDYRHQSGTFDRIVSVGMFEHVGVTYYRAFFDKVASLLADDGVAVIHTIGRSDGPGATDPWIRRYIFPGGYIPALSEVSTAIEASGLMIADVEVLRLHYAETLRHWQGRFSANRQAAARLYDERFCRLWEYYLAASEATFRHLGTVVHQYQLIKDQAALPITRDYITAWDQEHREPGGSDGDRDDQRAA